MKDLSAPAEVATKAQQTGEEPLVVLTIDHPDLAAPIRLVDAAANVVKSGDTYQWYPFRVTVPSESKDELPSVSIELAAVDRTIGDALRALRGAPSVEFAVVLASSPDVTEFGPYHFQLVKAQGDVSTLAGTLTLPAILDEQCPGGAMTPATHPGLFQA